MRTLSLVVLTCVAVSGSALAQHYTPYSTPSRLSYPNPAYGAAYMQPAKPPMSMDKKPEALPLTDAPQPVPSGAVVHEDAGCDGCNNGYGGWGLPHVGPSCGASCCNSCCNACGCGGCGCGGCGCGCCGCWFGSLSGLIMTRDDNNAVWTSYDPNIVSSALLGTPDAEPDEWRGGFEATIGRRLCCGLRVAATYWTLDPDHAQRTISSDTGQISSSLNFQNLDFGGGGVQGWFDNAQAHRVAMRTEFHNVEVNLLSGCCSLCNPCDPCRPLRLSGLAGFRFFRFNEDFEFATSENATSFGVDPTNEAYYNVDVDNNLIGFQIGGRAEWQAMCGLCAYTETRLGIYYNYMEQHTTLQTGLGDLAFDAGGNVWDINTDKDDFATLAQVDIGLKYQITCNWSAHLGYRLLAASGVALSTNQIPPFIADIGGIRSIDSNGHLFLHGAVAGVSACY